MSGLSVSELRKGYAGTPVLRDLELQAPGGSVTAVLGRSGCGKTTLLRVIAGFERAEHGTISLDRQTLEDARIHLAPELRGIGYVPQEGALFPHLSVRENVAFGLSRRERRGEGVAGLLEMVGIAPLAHRLPHELSGGEQQRVALARALARRPRALLLDEPFSSLDASLRTQVREEVHALLCAQGVTTVLVTHDQEEALSLADLVAVLRDGTIVQSATPAALYEQPVDEQLARFLGAINVIDARFERGLAYTQLGALQLRDAPANANAGAVMIRPEQLDVRPRGQADAASDPNGAPPGREGVSGQVEQCRYYGHDALLYIRPQGSDGMAVLLARVHGEHALAVGTPVTVAAHGPVAPL